MKASIVKGALVLVLALNTEAKLSASGKTRCVAQYSGPLNLTHDGKPLKGSIIVNVYPEPREALNARQSGVKTVVVKPAKAGEPATVELTIPMFAPRVSSTGKSMLVATASGGTGTKLSTGHELNITASAYYPAPKEEPAVA